MIGKFNQNPLAQFEVQAITRGQHAGATFLPLERWAFVAMVGLAAIFLIVGLSAGLFAPEIITTPGNGFVAAASSFAWLLCLAALYFHFRLMLVTLSLGVESIVRTNSKAWEHIVLTGMSARKVIMGKWWAVINLSWSRYVLLGVIRAGAVLALGLVIYQQFPLFFADADVESDLFWRLLAAVVLTFIITQLNGLFTAISGTAGALRNTGTTPNISTAFATRATGIVLIAIPMSVLLVQLLVNEPTFATLEEYDYYRLNDPQGILTMITMTTMVSLIDGGSVAAGALANPFDFTAHLWIWGLLFVLVGYVLLTGFVFWLTQRSAQNKGLLP